VPTRCALLAIALIGASARGETLRLATVAPEGTAWARLTRSVAREVENDSGGRLTIKIYFGGIAGDEMEMLARLRRQQLDGVFSGGMLCERLAPTYRVMRIPGLFQSRDENAYVLGRLKPELDKEFLEQGFVHIASAGIGPSILFSRAPVTTMAELRAHPFWVWDIDEPLKTALPLLGMQIKPAPISSAGRTYEAGAVDGFIAPPAAALAFQWSAQVRYFTDLRMGYISACLLIDNRAYDPLPRESKRAIVTATARLQSLVEEQGRRMDEELMGGLFQKQGLQRVPVSESFRAEFLDIAQRAREKMTSGFVSAALVQRVLGMLADFRGSR
jgi:TRAP-type C4-dicarboxylate transport system substrate-binding protein